MPDNAAVRFVGATHPQTTSHGSSNEVPQRTVPLFPKPYTNRIDNHPLDRTLIDGTSVEKHDKLNPFEKISLSL
jgi:hypothetical protein